MALPVLQHKIQRENWSVLYSTWQLTNAGGTLAGQTFSWFSASQGQPGQGYAAPLTFAETNLRTPNQVPAQQGFEVHGVAFSLMNGAANSPVSAADSHNILDGAVAWWDWQQSQTYIAPLNMIGSGGAGLFGVAGTVGAVAAEITNGSGGFWRLPQPVTLAPLATWNIKVIWPVLVKAAPVVTTLARFTLIGQLTSLVDAG